MEQYEKRRAIVAAEGSALATLAQRAAKTIEDAVPPNTRRGYEGDLRRFAAWCNSTGLAAMPAAPETVAFYMRHLADEPVRVGQVERPRKIATIERAVAAICTSHSRSGHPSLWAYPLVADMLTALRRELGTRPTKKKAADDEILRHILAVLGDDLLSVRDRALILLAWCGALRRSEVVALDVSDVRRTPKGPVVTVGKSKTDQEQRGEDVPIFYSNTPDVCPVHALDAWLAAAGITAGAIFRRLGRRQELGGRLAPAAVRDRVRHWAKVAGLKPEDFAGHSLRSGFITTAARRGRDLDSIMVTTRHRSEKVARGYIERETLHERGAGEGLL